MNKPFRKTIGTAQPVSIKPKTVTEGISVLLVDSNSHRKIRDNGTLSGSLNRATLWNSVRKMFQNLFTVPEGAILFTTVHATVVQTGVLGALVLTVLFDCAALTSRPEEAWPLQYCPSYGSSPSSSYCSSSQSSHCSSSPPSTAEIGVTFPSGA